ncbi:PfkB family carbohydrate kinase [Homoserinibacter sp. YIM 151385]|uniref:PfkB family carbohydrate kinase n=1 Tax=Homoserinibacter sp. YIM 151385 TaxID=2985506 RepID=UPI0022EFE189|nr:PfkB family carbohydrate kinase [Homoserinibacter sp. YIM 151385]WBU37878.1 PfkB family carbohydrate kinase [Homoserinibacter sp. YIM 151385]
MSPRVAIFAPSPVLTVTIEDHGGGPDLHVHAGGQGLWQARLLESLGVEATLCAALLGESGALLGHLLRDVEGIDLMAIERDGRAAAYVHDRRGGERVEVMDTAGDALGRHELDDLYGLTLRAGLDADAVILSGPAGDGVVPDDIYARLAADLGHAGRLVIADLAGARLDHVLEGGVGVLKVSDEELEQDGRADGDDDDSLLAAALELQRAGAERVIITHQLGAIAVDAEAAWRVRGPELQVVDTRGSGDSLTAAVTATLITGGTFEAALRRGAAAGAANVTRHGLGSADAEAIRALEELVAVEQIERN